MLKREQIELILRTNGVDPSSPTEEIRSVLMSARYNQDEIDTAIMVLREDSSNNTSRVDALHKVFRTDQALKPAEISALLGIEVNVNDLKQQRVAEAQRGELIHVVVVLILALTLAALCIYAAMYVYQVGAFHPDAYRQ